MKECLEEWKAVSFLENKFEVSNFGRIRNSKTKKIRKTSNSKRGYPVFSAWINGKRKLINVHKCVAVEFIPNPKDLPQVNHIDGNKENNHIENLEWCTARENNIHARETGLHKSNGDKSVTQIKNGEIIAIYKSASQAAKETGLSRSGICHVCNHYVTKNGKHHRTCGGYIWEWTTKNTIM